MIRYRSIKRQKYYNYNPFRYYYKNIKVLNLIADALKHSKLRRQHWNLSLLYYQLEKKTLSLKNKCIRV